MRTALGTTLLLATMTLEVAIGQTGVVPPKLTNRVEPPAITNPFGLPMEGWIVVRYSVLADGSVSQLRVVDRMPPRLPDGEVLAAVEQWVFEPATDGGNPIDWHNNETVVIIDSETVPEMAGPLFTQGYIAVDELMTEAEPKKAAARSEQMLAQTQRLAEISLGQTQAARVHMALEDTHAAYESILRATDARATTLSGDQLKVALQYRFLIELALGRVVEALATYDRVETLGLDATTEQLTARAETIRQALTGEGAIAIRARVGQSPWRHAPSRRTFAIADLDGNIRDIDVECDRRKTSLEYMEDVEWSLPQSWGNCEIFIDARRDTTFTLYEFK
jgi:TonB family protein